MRYFHCFIFRSEGKNSLRKGEVSSHAVTSTSEEEKLDQMLSESGAEYGKDNWSRISRPRVPRPLAGEAQKTERRYAHGIPSNMLVPATQQSATHTSKVDKFGVIKLTLVERDGYSQSKVEDHSWLEEKQGGVGNVVEEEDKEEVVVPKDLQCPFCCELLEAAILLPCCTAAACDECARNSLIEKVGGSLTTARYL